MNSLESSFEEQQQQQQQQQPTTTTAPITKKLGPTAYLRSFFKEHQAVIQSKREIDKEWFLIHWKQT